MINIRNAIQVDIEQFKVVIESSILAFCKDYYTTDQIDALLGQYPDAALYTKWIDDRVLIVAENENSVIGFAQYNPENNSVEAIHVSPKYACNGIGSKLVKKIEEIAKSQGADKITLGASLNAVDFYAKCGYRKKEITEYKCNNGITLKTVVYEKEFTN